jgi:hypothetical protein
MTSAVRLPEALRGTEDISRDDAGGVWVCAFPLVCALVPESRKSEISTNSSESDSGKPLFEECIGALPGAGPSPVGYHLPSGSIVTCSVLDLVEARISSTYLSTARPSNATTLLHTGHVQVGACSCN